MLQQAEQEVLWYERAIEKAYTQLRHRYRCELRYLSKRDQAKIKCLAEDLYHNKIDPYNYVNFVFNAFVRLTGDVFFDMIASPKMVKSYVEDRPMNDDIIRRRVSSQYALVENEKAKGRTIHEILTDYQLQINAVIRFAIAWTVGDDELCDLFRQDAERMMLFEPLYRELLKDALPEEQNCDQASNANRT